VGGAGIVSKHIRAAGVKVTLHSIIGNDSNGKFSIDDLRQHDVEFKYILDNTRPTTNKNAIIADSHRMLRIDEVSNANLNSDQIRILTEQIFNSKANAIIFSDFRHGIFNKSSIDTLVESIPEKVFKVADSQVASRWGNILDFRNFDLITPNEQEVRFALADQDTVIRPLGTELLEKSGSKYLMLKLGAKGMLTFRKEVSPQIKPSFFAIDALVRGNIIDPVGSGDALLAYATIVLLKTKNEVVASIIGTIAAGLACQKEGNVPVKPSEINSFIEDLEYMLDAING
jgi:rfaE bifunctional protein kinase chain/domain